MAEECVDVPMVSEATKSNVELRRHSSGKTSSENNEQKVVPRYLRASTGSCHDFSKYGKKLALEAKKRSFIPRIAEREQLHQRLKEKIGEVVVTSSVKFRASNDSEPTKTSLVKHRASTDSGTTKTPLVKLRSLIDSEPTKASLVKRRASTDSETTKTPLFKLRTSIDSEPTKMSLVKSRESTESEVVVDKKKTPSVKGKQSSLRPKSHNSSAYKTRRQEISSTFKMETTPRPIFKRVGPSSISTSKKEESQLKSNSKRVKTPISTSQTTKTSSKSTSKKMQTSSKLFEKHATLLKLDSSNVASPSRDYSSLKSSRNRITGINMHKSLKTVARVKNQPKPRKVESDEPYKEAEEKTLYVIMVENEGQTSTISQSSSQEDQEESKYATNEIENGKVVLRHQDLNGKKDEQVLMNNVIEETSRKLVGTQNSKVKALVGAFETLISLNERKT